MRCCIAATCVQSEICSCLAHFFYDKSHFSIPAFRVTPAGSLTNLSRICMGLHRKARGSVRACSGHLPQIRAYMFRALSYIRKVLRRHFPPVIRAYPSHFYGRYPGVSAFRPGTILFFFRNLYAHFPDTFSRMLIFRPAGSPFSLKTGASGGFRHDLRRSAPPARRFQIL